MRRPPGGGRGRPFGPAGPLRLVLAASFLAAGAAPSLAAQGLPYGAPAETPRGADTWLVAGPLAPEAFRGGAPAFASGGASGGAPGGSSAGARGSAPGGDLALVLDPLDLPFFGEGGEARLDPGAVQAADSIPWEELAAKGGRLELEGAAGGRVWYAFRRLAPRPAAKGPLLAEIRHRGPIALYLDGREVYVDRASGAPGGFGAEARRLLLLEPSERGSRLLVKFASEGGPGDGLGDKGGAASGGSGGSSGGGSRGAAVKPGFYLGLREPETPGAPTEVEAGIRPLASAVPSASGRAEPAAVVLLPDRIAYPRGSAISAVLAREGGSALLAPGLSARPGREPTVELLAPDGRLLAAALCPPGGRFSLEPPVGFSGPALLRVASSDESLEPVEPRPVLVGELSLLIEEGLRAARGYAAAAERTAATAAYRAPEAAARAELEEAWAAWIEGRLALPGADGSSLALILFDLQCRREGLLSLRPGRLPRLLAVRAEGGDGEAFGIALRDAAAEPGAAPRAGPGAAPPALALVFGPGESRGRSFAAELSPWRASSPALVAEAFPDRVGLAFEGSGSGSGRPRALLEAMSRLGPLLAAAGLADGERVSIAARAEGALPALALAEAAPGVYAALAIVGGRAERAATGPAGPPGQGGAAEPEAYGAFHPADLEAGLESLAGLPLILIRAGRPDAEELPGRAALEALGGSAFSPELRDYPGSTAAALKAWAAEGGPRRLLSELAARRREAWPARLVLLRAGAAAGRGPWAAIEEAEEGRPARAELLILDERHLFLEAREVLALSLDLGHPALARSGRLVLEGSGGGLALDAGARRVLLRRGGPGAPFVLAEP